MRCPIVPGASWHHDQIRLGLGFVVEGHRRLEPHDPSRGHDGPQRIVDLGDRGGMVRALRLGDDELAADQLDGLALEHSEIHQPVVLRPLPAPQRERDLHAPTVAGGWTLVNVPGRIRVRNLRGAGLRCAPWPRRPGRCSQRIGGGAWHDRRDSPADVPRPPDRAGHDASRAGDRGGGRGLPHHRYPPDGHAERGHPSVRHPERWAAPAGDLAASGGYGRVRA